VKLYKVLGGVTGLNTKDDPVRLPYNEETGVQDLAVAFNVDVEDTGRVSRRKGFTNRIDANCHSLFAEENICLFVTGDALCWMYPDYGYAGLRNVTIGAKMRYCRVDDAVYYLNGYEIGKAISAVSSTWVMGTYSGPDTDRVYSDPPMGTDVCYHNGRIYIAQGDTVWYSEPFGFNLFDLTRSYWKVDSRVRTLRAVKDGIFVGSETNTYFYKGDEPKDTVRSTVATYPIIQYSDVNFLGRLVFPIGGGKYIDTHSGSLSALWLSEKGICYGGHDGDFYNLTEEKIVMPAGISGSGLVFDGRYVGLINP